MLTWFQVLLRNIVSRCKSLKDGWMEYDNGQESLLTFVQGKVKIPEGAECVCVLRQLGSRG